MSDMIEQTRFVERIQFFNGQRLFADDLQSIEAFNRQMRWLHNRSLHQPGIGSGLAITGLKGERQVTVNPGYAIDGQGREIVLTQPHVLQVPPSGGGADGQPAVFDLTISYPEDESLEEAEVRRGVCDTVGVVRLREAPVFCWVPLERDDRNGLHAEERFQKEILEAKKILLGRVQVRNCSLDSFVDIRLRRDARPTCLPYVACGVDSATRWGDGEKLRGNTWVYPAVANTSSGAFQTAPRYQAQIYGPIEMTARLDVPVVDPGLVEGGVLLAATDSSQDVKFVLVYNVFVQRQELRELEVIVVVKAIPLSEGLGPEPESDARVEQVAKAVDVHIRSHWKVQWMGVEG